jgi:formate hydrogenlyase subunit 3/multisubunit Na+/H+ antiporter MnhD subunit
VIAAVLGMIALPLVMALLLLWPAMRPVVVRALGLAPLPALLLLPAAWSDASLQFTLPGGWTFVVDQPGALMLLASAVLWIIGGFAASRWLTQREGQGRFALWWLLTLAGSLGVFVAGDVAGFYALYALASLPAYGLIVFEGSEGERRAGRIALAAALLGEGLILAAFVLLAASAAGQGLAIATLMQSLAASPHASAIIALVVIGFGLKIGLVPLHGWMPMSYAAGPLVATAVLSGATSKAGIIGFIRFVPLDTAMPVAGSLILAAGLVSAFYGAIIGLTQTNPRSVLAYSSISQLGQMAAVLGVGLAAGAPGAATAVAFYAVYHVLTKGGLFLMLGAKPNEGLGRRWHMALAAVMALGFAGLPLTGGALGKIAAKDFAGGGMTGVLLSFAAVGSTVLMLHFVRLAMTSQTQQAKLPGATASWVASAVAATALQWLLFAAATGKSAASALEPSVLLELAWPVAAGCLLAWGLISAGTQLPRLPPGDVMDAAFAGLERTARRLAERAVGFESLARRWSVSSLMLGVATIVLVVLQWFAMP